MAMVMVVIGYAALFSDMGLSAAFIQRPQISHEERSSLYWLGVIVGAALMLLTVAVGPLIAYLFKAPQLSTLLALVATNFLVVALGQQLRINAEKALNFRPVAIIEVSAAGSGFAVALLAAWLGWGVYSLVAAAMLSVWVTTLLSWAVLAQGWRPMWRLHWLEVRWCLRFGGGMVMGNLINQVNSTVDVLLGGRLLGTAQLGIYSVPRNLILQIQSVVNPVFTRVGFPVISTIQHDQVRVRQVYSKIMNLTATVNAPIYVALGVFAPEFVQLFFGSNFQDASPLMRILALWGLLRSFGNPVGSLLFGLGRVRLALIWNFSLLFVVPPALWWGSHYGTVGMAWAMTAVMVVLFVPGWFFLVWPACGMRLREYVQQVLLPSLCAAIAGGVAWLAVNSIDMAWLRLGLGLVFGAILYMALTWILNRECRQLVLDIFKRRAPIAIE